MAQNIPFRHVIGMKTGTAIGASAMEHYFSKKRVNPLGRHKLGSKKRRLHSPV